VGASPDFEELGLCGVVDEKVVEAARGKRDEASDDSREEAREAGEVT
jgi:hypothetical protein